MHCSAVNDSAAHCNPPTIYRYCAQTTLVGIVALQNRHCTQNIIYILTDMCSYPNPQKVGIAMQKGNAITPSKHVLHTD